MKIGIFDSGIGGLSLLFELGRRLPEVSFIYYADSKHAPYGERSPDNIVRLTSDAVDFLRARGADAVVLACNTATAVAARPLRDGGTFVFGMEPAVNQAAKHTPRGKILAAATPVTLSGEKYRDLLERIGAAERTVSLPLPHLVRLAEGELFGECRALCPDAESYIRSAFADTGVEADEISAVVLGCTHFTFFREEFRRIFPDRPMYNGVDGTASNIIKTLSLSERENGESIADRTEFYISGEAATGKDREGFLNCLSLL